MEGITAQPSARRIQSQLAETNTLGWQRIENQKGLGASETALTEHLRCAMRCAIDLPYNVNFTILSYR